MIRFRECVLAIASVLTLFSFSLVLSGCGSYSPPRTPLGPVPGVKTTVLVLLTNTANDALIEFHVTIASLSLTDSAGNQVTVYNNLNSAGFGGSGPAEFSHLNGVSEPLVVASIPQAVYTSATVTVGACDFTYVWFNTSDDSLTTSSDAEGLCGQGTGNATVSLSAPLVIDGSTVVLSLNLLQSQSYAVSRAATSGGPDTYTISPVFTLGSVAISPQPTDDLDGKLLGLDMRVESLDKSGAGFTATTPDGAALHVSTGSSTVFQGIPDFSSVSAGMLLNADLDIQPDASLAAARIEVDEAAAPMEMSGPYVAPINTPGGYIEQGVQEQGCSITGDPFCGTIFQFDANTVFKVSGLFTNLSSLPFTPVFNASTVFPGQILKTYSPGTFTSQQTELATTATLIPQTINGTVASISNQNGFAVYTVNLAPYDLIPTLQQQVGPIPRIVNPNTVVVYVDTTAPFLNTGDINVGTLLRFYGVIFNDGGTLRMDCLQTKDGVAE